MTARDTSFLSADDSLVPKSDECVIAHFRLQADPKILAHFRSLLSRNEIQRADRFLRPEHGEAFTVAHGVLRIVLGKILDTSAESLVFDEGEFGKPELNPLRLQFNLSHSGGYAAIAIARACAVGIDIEGPRPTSNLEKLAQRYFTPEEVTALEALPESLRQSAFYRVWSSKEAMMKVTGRGLGLGLNNFTVEVSPESPPGLITPPADYPDSANYTWFETPIASNINAVAVAESTDIQFRVCPINLART